MVYKLDTFSPDTVKNANGGSIIYAGTELRIRRNLAHF